MSISFTLPTFLTLHFVELKITYTDNRAIWRWGAPVLLSPSRTHISLYKKGAASYADWQKGRGRHLQKLNPQTFLTEVRVAVLHAQHRVLFQFCN